MAGLAMKSLVFLSRNFDLRSSRNGAAEGVTAYFLANSLRCRL